jgi:NAD(P)-dependent dehydrogenase (short-subunit alcohol dehydrogenase family)
VTPRKHTLIVGGTKGAGRTFAERAAAAGHVVSVLGRTPATENADKPRARHWTVDVADRPALDAVLGEVIEVNGSPTAVVLFQRYRGKGDTWAGELATTLTATKQIIEWAADHADAAAAPSIVVIGSSAARFIATEQPVSYHVAKAAIVQMARFYAVRLGPAGVRVNVVSSGTIVKDESRAFYEAHPDLVDLYKKITPLGRMCTAADIADVVMFLCGPESSFITGQNLVVDGGLSLRWHESLARELSPLGDLPITSSGGRTVRGL